jgi:hypothetical protein
MANPIMAPKKFLVAKNTTTAKINLNKIKKLNKKINRKDTLRFLKSSEKIILIQYFFR